MGLEECDYRTATGFAVFRTPTPIDNIYHDEWYELLNAQKNRPSITEKEARKNMTQGSKRSLLRRLQSVGTLRSETRRLYDAVGSNFLRRRHIAHAHAVVLMASRRVENVGLAILTFCTKREYIPFCA